MLGERVVFLDGEALVIDKPAGLPVDRPRDGAISLENHLNSLTFGFQRWPQAVHRLDRDTSGCLLLSRNPKAHARFQQAFEAGVVEKRYVAILDGVPEGESGVVDLPLAKVSTVERGWWMTGDRKGKSVAESETRLARIVGRDHGEGDAATWAALAGHFAEAQLRLLHDAAAALLSRPDMPADAPLVTCGAGAFVGDRLAARLGRGRVGLAELLASRVGEAASTWISTCGPAVAVGLIAEDLTR